MGILGALLGKAIVLVVAGGVGFVLGGPIGAGIAVSQAAVAANTAGLVGMVAPL